MGIQEYERRLARAGIHCLAFDGGVGDAGSIKAIRRAKTAKEVPRYDLHVNKNHIPPVKFVTLAHELAHLFLGHLGADRRLSVPDRSVTHKQAELEAESVAFLVCARNGVKSKSEVYLSEYVARHDTIDDLDLYQVFRAAGQVESALGLTINTVFERTRPR